MLVWHLIKKWGGIPTDGSQLPSQVSDEFASLDVVFDLTRDQLSFQMSQVDGLDTKAGFVLASASLLTGALATWHVPATTSYSPFIATFIQHIPLISILIYLVVIVTSFMAIMVRTYEYPTAPTQLRELYLHWPEQATKRKMRANIEAAYIRNEEKIKGKTRWTLAAFGALAIEALIVAVILFFLTAA